MDIASGLVILAILLLTLASGLWIALALFVTGFITLHFMLDAPAGLILATSTWSAADNWTLTALPLFILMGELLFRTRISDQIFTALSPWASRVPGGLLHVNVVGCGIFSAASGSSTATMVTVGKITMPVLAERRYDPMMAMGSLAGSGTFGLLIPPSIMLIIYGFVAEVSISKLFLAGVGPGIMLILLFSTYIALWALRHPEKAPRDDARLPLGRMLWQLAELLPMAGLIGFVMASMYLGIATATEAASIGVLGALVLMAAHRVLTFATFKAAVLSSVKLSTMILFLLIAAAYLTKAMGYSGIPDAIAAWVVDQQLGFVGFLVLLTGMYILLGLFLDGVSMLVLTAPVVLPSINAMGIDPIWFGIYIVLVVEMSLITPPVGLNLFVLQSMVNKDLFTVARACVPFFFLLILGVALLAFFPQVALFLPGLM